MEKVCKTCEVLKPIAEFEKHNFLKDGHRNQCKACRKESRDPNRVRPPVVVILEKTCRDCWQVKAIDQFHKNRTGRLNDCKECRRDYDRRRIQTPTIAVVEKTCKYCGHTKLIDHFHKASRNNDGHDIYCRQCSNESATKYKKANLEHYKAKQREKSARPQNVLKRREYAKTPAGKEARRKSVFNYEHKHPTRRAAMGMLSDAIAAGKVERQPCWVCGSLKVDGHHPTYDYPLDVIWLCRKHHKQLHKEAMEVRT